MFVVPSTDTGTKNQTTIGNFGAILFIPLFPATVLTLLGPCLFSDLERRRDEVMWLHDRPTEWDKEQIAQREYGLEDVRFYAILGTPQGISVARLLQSYASRLATRDDGNPDIITKVKSLLRVVVQYGPETWHQDEPTQSSQSLYPALQPIPPEPMVESIVFELHDVPNVNSRAGA